MYAGLTSGYTGQVTIGVAGPSQRVATENEELLIDLRTERDLIIVRRQLEELGGEPHQQLAIRANNRPYEDNHYIDYSDYPCDEGAKAPVLSSAPPSAPAKRPGLLQRLFGR